MIIFNLDDVFNGYDVCRALRIRKKMSRDGIIDAIGDILVDYVSCFSFV